MAVLSFFYKNYLRMSPSCYSINTVGILREYPCPSSANVKYSLFSIVVSTTITAFAPANYAYLALVTNVQFPLYTNIIGDSSSLNGFKGEHASSGSAN